MIEGGKLEKNATEVVWTSDPLPNDAIAVRKGFDPALAERIQKLLLGITESRPRRSCRTTTRASSPPTTRAIA